MMELPAVQLAKRVQHDFDEAWILRRGVRVDQRRKGTGSGVLHIARCSDTEQVNRSIHLKKLRNSLAPLSGLRARWRICRRRPGPQEGKGTAIPDFYPTYTVTGFRHIPERKNTLSTGVCPRVDLLLLLLRSPDAVIRSLQSEDPSDRAGRAEASFLVKCAGRRFSPYTEDTLIISSHALIIGRARVTDALSPVLYNDGIFVPGHSLFLFLPFVTI